MKSKKHHNNVNYGFKFLEVSQSITEVSQGITKVSQKKCTNDTTSVQNDTTSVQNDTTSVQNDTTSVQNDTTSVQNYVCEDCQKNFTRKNNLYRHKKHYCSGIVPKKETLENKLITGSDAKNILSLVDKKSLVEYVKNEMNIDFNNNSHNDITYINNNTNCNNTNYNTINNININPLGKEDISFITEDIKMRILENIYMAVPELIKTVHNHDCNRNFFIKNMNKQIMGYIDIDNQLKFDDYKNVIEKIVDNNIDRLNDFYIDLQDKIQETYQRKIQKMLDTSNGGELNEKYIDNIKYYVLDNTNRNKQIIKDVIDHS
jgi:hypothetical protein